MALLFVTPQEITNTTVLGGNVDVNKYEFEIESAQITVIEPLLGSELYDKIVIEAGNETITGLYLTLYTEFIKPITKYTALAKYISTASLMISNGGIFKHQPANSEIATPQDVDGLGEKYNQMAQTYIKRFEKWISKNQLTEYKTYQDEVNAQNVTVRGGWYFGDDINDDYYDYKKQNEC